MAEVIISGWKDNHVGWTGWDSHARAELVRRIRSSVNISASEAKHLAQRLRARESVTISNVRPESLERLRQILETQGAIVSVSLP